MSTQLPTVVVDARAYFTGGGIGRYTRNLVRELVAAREGCALRLLISDRHTPADLAIPAQSGLDVVVSRAEWMDVASEDTYLEEEVAGASLFHSLTGHWLSARVPSVATVHDLMPLVHPMLFTADQRRHSQRIAATITKAVRVLAVSETTAKDVRRLLGRRVPPLVVVPEASDPVFSPDTPPTRIGAQWGLRPDAFILAVSPFYRHKNIGRLVEAYAKSAIDIPLALVGAHRDATSEVKETIKRFSVSNRVHLIGTVSDADLATLYAASRLFVFPSLYEGFGLPVLEAMACGAAVLGSAIGAVAEVTGDAAVLVNATDTWALAQAMHRLDRNAAQRGALKERSLERAATFSWTRTAHATLDAYRVALTAHAA